MRHFHDQGVRDARLVVPVVVSAFPSAKSFLDVGCGTGAFVAEFARQGFRSIGLERSPHGRKLALGQKVDCRDFDLTRSIQAEMTEHFDVLSCFEVAEHMPADLGDKLVEFLARFCSPIVFSAAQPGQGGTGHINEQPPQYWIERFERFGFFFDSARTEELRSGFAANGAAPWFQRNTTVLIPG
jgi:SAM-dependent methyltransferase